MKKRVIKISMLFLVFCLCITLFSNCKDKTNKNILVTPDQENEAMQKSDMSKDSKEDTNKMDNEEGNEEGNEE